MNVDANSAHPVTVLRACRILAVCSSMYAGSLVELPKRQL